MARSALTRVLQRNLREALRLRQLAQAEELLRQLRDEEPLSVETRGMELELLIAAGHWREAETLSQQLLRLFPSSARVHYLAGRVCYRRKQYGAAAEHFSESHRLHPHWTARWWVGKCHTQRGEYDSAEGVLIGLAAEHPEVRRDLAWLYERRGEPARALRELDAYLARHPDDRSARAQQLRLRADAAPPEVLVEEVATLEALGEELAPEVLPAYVQRLLESGRSGEARRFVDEHAAAWSPEVAARTAWICYRLHAYDLALRLFLAGLALHHEDFKYCSALESAAIRCGRAGEVAGAYRALADQHRHLHGRLRALLRRTE